MALFALIRFALIPPVLQDHISRHLATMEEYNATYSNISISLLDGSFSLSYVKVTKKGYRLLIPLLQAEKMTFSIEMASLWKGALVSEISLLSPTVCFIKGVNHNSSQTRISSEFLSVVNKLSFLAVNELTIQNGTLRYYDFHSTPRIELAINDININASNLQNVDNEERMLSSLVEGSAKVEEARIKIDMELNSFYKSPMFRLSAELTNLDLYVIKNFLKAYGGVDIERGIFSLYTHASTRNDKVVGYVKPEMEDITMASNNKEHDSRTILRQNQIFLTAGHRARLNEIQFEGKLDKPDINIWDAVAMTLHNAFIEGLLVTMETSSAESQPPPIIKPKVNVSKVSVVRN